MTMSGLMSRLILEGWGMTSAPLSSAKAEIPLEGLSHSLKEPLGAMLRSGMAGLSKEPRLWSFLNCAGTLGSHIMSGPRAACACSAPSMADTQLQAEGTASPACCLPPRHAGQVLREPCRVLLAHAEHTDWQVGILLSVSIQPASCRAACGACNGWQPCPAHLKR